MSSKFKDIKEASCGDTVVFRATFGAYEVMTLNTVSAKTVSVMTPGTTFSRKRLPIDEITAIYGPGEFHDVSRRVERANRMRADIGDAERTEKTLVRPALLKSFERIHDFVVYGGELSDEVPRPFTVTAPNWHAVFLALFVYSPRAVVTGAHVDALENGALVLHLTRREIDAIMPHVSTIADAN